MTEHNDTIIIASISLFLYTSLAIVSFYQSTRFWDFKLNQIREGLYFKPKFIFFIILVISACFDLPWYIGCLDLNAPDFCDWDGDSFLISFHFHLIAVCGYVHSIISTAILWSDVINHKDGMLWYSSSPLDETKIFFRICFISYCIIITVSIILDINDRYTSADYQNDKGYQGLNYCLDPVFLFIIVCGCLVTGIRLQRYVMQVQLGSQTQIKALFTLNLIMVIIVCTYFLRALCLLSLWQQMPISYQNAFHPISEHYKVWAPLTKWLPFIMCSFFLIYSMRYKTNDSPIENNDTKIKNIHAIERVLSIESTTTTSEFGIYQQPSHSGEQELTKWNSYLEFGRAYNKSTEEVKKDNFLTINDLKKHSTMYTTNPLNHNL